MGEPVTDEAQPTLGQLLRERREARGISQEEAAQRSRVQLVFVRALEADDYRLLPDELYLSRFVYEYAGFLGLEPAAAADAFRQQLRRSRTTSPLYAAVPLVAALPWRRVLWTAAVLLPLIPLTFVLLSLVGKERKERAVPSPQGAVKAPALPAGPRTPDAESLPPAAPVGSPEVRSTFPMQPSAPARSMAGEPAARRHLLEARAHGITWLAVRVDGEPEDEVWLREGEMRRWTAEREFIVAVGNPRSVDIRLDGELVRLPDGKAEVVRDLRLPSLVAPPKRDVSLESAPAPKKPQPSTAFPQPIESKRKNPEKPLGAFP